MKISRKRLKRLIDERVDRNLRRLKKKERQLQKQLDEVYALMDDYSVPARSSARGRRFE